ncbi:TPA: TonB-dependent siderophore receptor [Klebsiella oxytoca]
MFTRNIRSVTPPLTLLMMGILSGGAYAADDDKTETSDETLVVTAAEELKQQPGVSIITQKDIEERPPVNDLSELIRKMPGVNLTGNSANGARGNNRQIDIRGMGPENTLILIDGMPATSRNSIRYSRTGERDTRGDSNWVPAEMVERIEVLRGPAAARYGSGAMGGVVNIITKRPTNDWHGSFSLFTNQPENHKEGDTRRANFSLTGPLIDDVLTMSLYGNINRTNADDYDINTSENGSYAAGREGVRNKDVRAKFSWKITPLQFLDFEYSYSRQGNIYAGDTQYSNSNISSLVPELYGQETNRLYRQTYGLTHNGIWDWGQSKLNLYYEKTNNTRLGEGSTGKVDGMINTSDFSTSRYESFKSSGEVNIPMNLWLDQNLTVGSEWTHNKLNDPASMANTTSIDGSSSSSKNSESLAAIYVEDNIEATPGTIIIPGLRFDYHSKFGANWSPSLNASQELGEYFKLKAGIARVFKAPNLYQSSDGFVTSSRGNGCPIGTSASCYLVGNTDLDPEVSVNKEIGIDFENDGYQAGITYFRNDYKNKIIAGDDLVGTYSGYNVYRWENGGKALVEGWEGNLKVPVIRDTLDWSTNFTYMVNSKNKDTGNPLSIIPKYTINTMLDWQVTEKLTANATWTMYGRQKPRKNAEIRTEVGAMSDREIGAYSVVALGAKYDITKNLRVNAGISNLLNKKVYREADGASTYNEPGRAYYTGLTYSF